MKREGEKSCEGACVEVEGRSKPVCHNGEATPRSQHESPGC